MNILALETSAQSCSVALQIADAGDQSAARVFGLRDTEKLSHSRRLLPMVESLLKEADTDIAQLDYIAVTQGPGSFTGLRIGIAAAQGLAFALALPVVPISSLAVVAFNAQQMPGLAEHHYVLATLDARMGELYCGWYDISAGIPMLVGAECVVKPGELPPLAAPCGQSVRQAIVGSGLVYREQISTDYLSDIDIVEDATVPDARALLALANHAVGEQSAVHAEALTPVYLRNNVTY